MGGLDGFFEDEREEQKKAKERLISKRYDELTSRDVDRVYGPPCYSDIMDGIAANNYYIEKNGSWPEKR